MIKRKWYIILTTFLIGTIGFWLFVLATYEIYWEINANKIVRRTIEVNSETGKPEAYWVGKKIHEDLLRTFLQDPKIEYRKSVDSFGPLQVGGTGPIGVVLSNIQIPINTKFYVFYNRMGYGMCNNEYCAPLGGSVIKCMGGWLGGDDQPESSGEVGLDNELVKQGKASMVVVSDSNQRIIGIFPYHTEADIIPILGTFPQFEESLTRCENKIRDVILGAE
jgi:hypothetical protein